MKIELVKAGDLKAGQVLSKGPNGKAVVVSRYCNGGVQVEDLEGREPGALRHMPLGWYAVVEVLS